LAYYEKKSKRKSRKPPQFAKVGMLVSVLIETSAPICIEKWDDYKMLGRFTLRDEGMFARPERGIITDANIQAKQLRLAKLQNS